jgi:hypothetical protein
MSWLKKSDWGKIGFLKGVKIRFWGKIGFLQKAKKSVIYESKSFSFLYVPTRFIKV